MTNIIPRISPIFGNITRFDPFTNVDEWFKNFGIRPLSAEIETSLIKIDLTENDTSYSVRAEIPGAKKEDVKVQVDGNHVSISATTKQEKEEKEGEKVVCRELYKGSSYRSFSVATDIDEHKALAKFENGILELTLPKKSGKTSRQLEIR